MALPTDALTRAASQIGVAETGGPDGHSGNITPYGAWYGVNGVPWCAIFVSWVFSGINALAAVGGKFAYCPYWVNYFKAAGRLYDTPLAGDLVFYNFGYLEAVHVGLVEKVLPGGLIQTIEGNTSIDNSGSQNNGGGVYRRVRSATWGVTGYGRPLYLQVPAPKPPPAPRVTVLVPTLAVDGVFGPATIAALRKKLGLGIGGWDLAAKKALQHWLGVTADGVVGPITIKALQTKLAVTVDGSWGPVTTRALQRYLGGH